jgi:hypothetical protein
VTPPDEPPFRSNRTDAATYAAEALESLLQGIALDERQQGYVREMLVSAFEDGETQGEFRALWVLTIAHRNAQSPANEGGALRGRAARSRRMWPRRGRNDTASGLRASLAVWEWRKARRYLLNARSGEIRTPMLQ